MRIPREPETTQNRSCGCVLLADDLTGACDSALQFSLKGAESVVHLDLDSFAAEGADVHAFDTETRDTESSLMRKQIERVADLVASSTPRIIFKKIDSLLRGNPGGEIEVSLRAFGCEFAIITPAFPAMGRTVRDGFLKVTRDADWQTLHVSSHLASQGLPGCEHVPVDALASCVQRGVRHMSFDVSCDADLLKIVREALKSDKRILWVGSAGLAAALAEVLFLNSPWQQAHEPGNMPLVFLIGSTHPITTSQVEALNQQRACFRIELGSTHASADLRKTLAEKKHAIVHIPLNRVHHDHIRSLLEDVRGRAQAIVMSGGDTASLICRAVTARKLEIGGQITTGLPWAIVRGGLLDGFEIATKSGGFGLKTDLINVADFFTCSNK